MPTVHSVKIWPEFFPPILNGTMKFQLRKNDRNYAVGDVLHLREYDDRAGKFTGREIKKTISYVMTSTGHGSITPFHGLSQGYAILSLADI